MNSLESIWLAYLSQPSCDRVLYRAIRKRKVRRIMEIGIGDLHRGLRMIRLAQRYHSAAEVRYIGVDMFEAGAAGDEPVISLKQAYRMLRATGSRVHLIPGDAIQSLIRSANALPGNELVLISAEQAIERFSQGWHYIPRMLAPAALLYAAEAASGKPAWRKLPAGQLPTLADAGPHRRAA